MNLVEAVEAYRQRAQSLGMNPRSLRGAGHLAAHRAIPDDVPNDPLPAVVIERRAVLEDLIREAERTAANAETLARKLREIVAEMEAS